MAIKLIPQQKEKSYMWQHTFGIAPFPCTALRYKKELQFKNLVKHD